MAQIFHLSTNTLARVSIFGAVLILAAMRGREYWRSLEELTQTEEAYAYWSETKEPEGDYVAGRWDGGGTHTGAAFSDVPVGSFPAASGKTMRLTGTTVFRLREGKIAEEIREECGLTALSQLGPGPAANYPHRGRDVARFILLTRPGWHSRRRTPGCQTHS